MSSDPSYSPVPVPSANVHSQIQGLNINPYGGISYQADYRLKAQLSRHNDLIARVDALRVHVDGANGALQLAIDIDRKSTRLNSSHT